MQFFFFLQNAFLHAEENIALSEIAIKAFCMKIFFLYKLEVMIKNYITFNSIKDKSIQFTRKKILKLHLIITSE